MRGRTSARYFFGPDELPAYVEFIQSKRGELMANVRTHQQLADNVLAHRFPEQVSTSRYGVQLGSKIDWDRQPNPTTNPNFLAALNRHGFWDNLAVTYMLTGDARYAKELVWQLRSWSAQTPAPVDPNAKAEAANRNPAWATLTAADRADNWVKAYMIVLGSADWTPEANTLMLHRLWQHGDFLSRKRAGSPLSNKTTVHGAALYKLGLLFPEFREAAVWERQGANLMRKCLAAQFRPDGGHVEQSPSYHAVAADLFLDAHRLAQVNGRSPWTAKEYRRLEKAVEVYYQLGGSQFALSDTYRSKQSFSFLNRAGLTFGKRRYITVVDSVTDVLTFGVDRVKDYMQFPRPGTVEEYDPGPRFALTDSGYYVLRGQRDPVFPSYQTRVAFDAGPKGGVHGHYDLLGIDVPGWILDPGPHTYDNSAQRKWVVSTPAHNTISVDGQNHAAIEEAHSPKIVVDRYEVTGDHALVTAHHHAYDHLKGAPAVGRTVWLDRSSERFMMVVVDWGRASRVHTFTTSLNLNSPAFGAVVDGVIQEPFEYAAMRVQSLPVAGQTYGKELRKVSVSPPPDGEAFVTRYAVSQRAKTAIFVNVITMSSKIVVDEEDGDKYGEVIATWEAPPRFGQPLRIRLTNQYNGESRVLEFAPPDLSPLGVRRAAEGSGDARPEASVVGMRTRRVVDQFESVKGVLA
jgi:hypothetical protein